MPLDPQAKQLLTALSESGNPPLFALPTIEDVRRFTHDAQIADAGDPRVPRIKTEDRAIPREPEDCGGGSGGGNDGDHASDSGGGIGVRIYTPRGIAPFPVFVYFHGGGWAIGDLDTNDALCKLLCDRSGSIVVSVDYRRAPENKCPAAARDAYAATEWAYRQADSFGGDSTRLAVGGDSAGANLAAVVCLMARDAKRRGEAAPDVRFQLLIFPATDHYSAPHPSYAECGSGYFLTTDEMVWFWDLYLGKGADPDDPYISPLRAPDLSGLPPAYIQTAEYDPLRDEGEEYAEKLRTSGTDAVCERVTGMMHGYFNQWASLDKGFDAVLTAAGVLKERLSNK
ncbi:MAG: alpha/beta hydrolase [Clostridiales Family XIII bacterium]|jgi:acetyl esterase|nr:alpha/beta hydrolase [Clostridiales Family XIII bacterium]